MLRCKAKSEKYNGYILLATIYGIPLYKKHHETKSNVCIKKKLLTDLFIIFFWVNKGLFHSAVKQN